MWKCLLAAEIFYMFNTRGFLCAGQKAKLVLLMCVQLFSSDPSLSLLVGSLSCLSFATYQVLSLRLL